MGSESNREESVGSQCEDQFVNLERRRDREVNHLPRCIQVIPAKATLELEAMSHMGRKLETLGWR